MAHIHYRLVTLLDQIRPSLLLTRSSLPDIANPAQRADVTAILDTHYQNMREIEELLWSPEVGVQELGRAAMAARELLREVVEVPLVIDEILEEQGRE